MGEIAPVGELKRTDTPLVAGLHHLPRDSRVRMIIDRHHARTDDRLQCLYLIESCHDLLSLLLPSDTPRGIALHQFLHLLNAHLVEVAINRMFQAGSRRRELQRPLVIARIA